MVEERIKVVPFILIFVNRIGDLSIKIQADG